MLASSNFAQNQSRLTPKVSNDEGLKTHLYLRIDRDELFEELCDELRPVGLFSLY